MYTKQRNCLFKLLVFDSLPMEISRLIVKYLTQTHEKPVCGSWANLAYVKIQFCSFLLAFVLYSEVVELPRLVKMDSSNAQELAVNKFVGVMF